MEDILFCKNLHDPLENKGDKPVATKDEEWRKMNRKRIGLIRQCIRHEVFHHVAQETSAYELWIKLEEMYQAKTSRNKALLMRRLVNLKLQRETTVAEHTSEFQNLEGHIKRDCPKYKAQDQSSDIAATAVMAVDEDEIDVLLAASEDGKMLDSKGCSFDTSGGTLRVSKGNKEMLWGKKTKGLYRLEESIQIGGATVRHGSSRIRKENGQGKRRDGATITRKVTYFAAHPGEGCDAPQWGVQGTSVRRCRHFGVESYGGAGLEAVRKDNLKTSDYPPVG
ncbi:hypothetical protein Acr_01g0005680 [Actinidia rufa]|uniref:Uncharacterized protein n=1 Tax=Actinidia rufa TaxID=165716 RepID=A0A7J0E491_9ERIC|nr:hypothetical protein Acr_01g0005680 [Actinidia rufa]